MPALCARSGAPGSAPLRGCALLSAAVHSCPLCAPLPCPPCPAGARPLPAAGQRPSPAPLLPVPGSDRTRAGAVLHPARRHSGECGGERGRSGAGGPCCREGAGLAGWAEQGGGGRAGPCRRGSLRASAASSSADGAVPQPRGRGPARPAGPGPWVRGRRSGTAAVSRAEGLAGTAARSRPAGTRAGLECSNCCSATSCLTNTAVIRTSCR